MNKILMMDYVFEKHIPHGKKRWASGLPQVLLQNVWVEVQVVATINVDGFYFLFPVDPEEC